MTPRRALILVLAIAAFAVSWAASRYAMQVGGVRTDARAAATAPGEPPDAEQVTLRFFRNPAAAPAFVARDLDGRDISTASLRGKVVLLNFWATWCPPCRAEIPDLVALQEKYRDQLQIIGISEDEGGPDVVRRLVAAYLDGAGIAVASYQGRLRNPVLLARSEWAGVMALATGDVGARPYLDAHPDRVTAVECGDIGRPDDVDTPEDLARVSRVLAPGFQVLASYVRIAGAAENVNRTFERRAILVDVIAV